MRYNPDFDEDFDEYEEIEIDFDEMSAEEFCERMNDWKSLK